MRAAFSKLQWAAIATLLVFTTACPPQDSRAILSPDPLYKFYLSHQWIPLPEPDSRFGPGAVFTFKPGSDPRWQGTLQDCGMPSDLTKAVEAQSGELEFNTSSDYGASAVLKLDGVTAGPQFSKVKSATLELERHGPSALNMVKLRVWLNDPDNRDKIPQVCKDLLNRADVYIVQEAYEVSKGKYTLKSEASGKVAVDGLKAGVLSLAPDAHTTIGSDGSLTFDETLYTAVRRLVYANGGWDSLGRPGSAADADQQIINQLPYLKQTK
jgi:hypothetical protein